MNEGALTKAQFLPLCQGQILKADPILKKKRSPSESSPMLETGSDSVSTSLSTETPEAALKVFP